MRIHTSLYRPPQFSMMGNWGGACGGCLYDSQFVIDKFEILQKTVDLKDRARLTQEVGDHMFALYPNIPLFWLRISFMYNPKVVAEYLTPGNLLPAQSHLEYVSAVK